ncbi:MAG: GNAT family N-acetyltransferase [Opitutaceae bacterium]
MRLIVPTLEEMRETLLRGAACWRLPDRICDDDAPPPDFMMQRSLNSIADRPELATWFAPRLFWAKEIGAIVGSGSFKTAPDHPHGAEIGYGIAARFQGHGYATAGVRLIITEAFAFPQVKEIFAEAQPDNLPSIRVLQKCDFAPDDEKSNSNDDRILRFHLIRRAWRS